MSEFDELLDSLATDLATTYPNRVVTREWKERDAHSSADQRKGIYTVLFRGETNPDEEYYQHLRLLILGCIRLGVDARGDEVETAELGLLEELKTFARKRPTHGLTVLSSASSGQLEAPDGWIVVECLLGPFRLGDETQIWEDNFTEAPEVLVSQAPDIGDGHAPNYARVDEL